MDFVSDEVVDRKMDGIKRLPKSVHNPLRSSIILCDLPRVVEELIYNSVDAGASKVFVSVGIRACYIKVEDDGCGITRDGLVILGERYATSKLSLLSDMETSTESLGFRGEALGSLSDVSLVEIRTKARGKPNAYRKILKGSKCLFLGIDDQREGVGTTVTVRELFYNQPVRRKYMHSSPKRVLHAVKKCVLRTALVYPQVSFTVTDIESEDEVVSTIPFSSPLPLVSDGFGNEVSNSLHEIVFSDQILVLSGYISGPADVFSTKAFQYIYINSRFICKGPIHNLLNNMAASFQCSQSQRQLEPEFHSAKRQKTLGYPAYMLNLCCPLSSYDLNFEPSKTIVEFKDWDTVLSFFEQSVMRFWKQLLAQSLQGKTFVRENSVPEVQKEGGSRSSKVRKNISSIQSHPNSLHRSITSHLDTLFNDNNVYKKHGRAPKELFRLSSELRPCQMETTHFGLFDSKFRDAIEDSKNVIRSTHDQMLSADKETTNVGSLLLENHFSSDRTIKAEEKDDISEKVWESSPEGTRNLKEESTSNMGSSRTIDITDNVEDVQYIFDHSRTNDITNVQSIFDDISGLRKLGIKNCSLMENKQGRDHSSFGYEFDHLGKDLCFHNTVDALDDNYFVELNLNRPFQNKIDEPSLGFLRKCQTTRVLDMLPTDATDAFTYDQANFTEENNLLDGLATQVWETSSRCEYPEGWLLGSPPLFSSRPSKTAHNLTHSFSLAANMSSSDSTCGGPFGTIEEKAESLNSIQKCIEENHSAMRYTRARYPETNMHYEYPPDDITYAKVCSSSKLDDEIDWLLSDSSNIMNTDSYTHSAFHISVQNHDKVVERRHFESEFQNCQSSHFRKARSRRSRSAPPFYKGKRKFSIINDHLNTIAGNDPFFHFANDARKEPDIICLSSNPSMPRVSQPNLDPIIAEDSRSCFREYIDENRSTDKTNGIQNGESDKAYDNQLSHTANVEDSATVELEYATDTLTKWQTGMPHPTDGDEVQTYPEQKDDILDVSSGLLHLSSGSLIPESINKDCLEGARVLLQLDRKFIPIMAGGTLAVIDQHAADERIRLEELRKKVFSGEGSSVTYLDSEQELVLPEMGFQLLQKYENQIQKWGWICNTHSQCSSSFAKNMNLLKRRTCGVTLVAVPCILGINLTAKDLVEYMDQLVETDGSSTVPSSVHRVLNFKSCRGAIMFGDPLLPSECSLIVEELKATSLCFQCAHGRPTTVPLLNMASLHELLAELEKQSGGPMEMWHGLCRNSPSIERAKLRLDSAKRFCNG